jgi:hypothetical protein
MITVKVYILWTLLGSLGILSLVMASLAVRHSAESTKLRSPSDPGNGKACS